jgi:hypothetical protein
LDKQRAGRASSLCERDELISLHKGVMTHARFVNGEWNLALVGAGEGRLAGREPLDPVEGPWRVIVPDDIRHARWIRNLKSIAVETVQR